MKQFNAIHAKALYLRFCAIYGDKFYKDYHDADFKAVWYAEWVTGLAGIDVCLIKDALEKCKLTLEWPPSILEFRSICEHKNGFPDMDAAFNAAIRREFTHPVILLAFQLAGSDWPFKNDKDQVLREKFKSVWQKAIDAYRTDPAKAERQLETRLSQPALPEPVKNPTKQECITFSQRYATWKTQAKEAVKEQPVVQHPEWPPEKINFRSSEFDQVMFMDRKKYLLELDESVAATLKTEDWYDRVCYFREMDAERQQQRISMGMH